MGRSWLYALVVLACTSLAGIAKAQRFHVEPYLQHGTPTTQAVGWETKGGTGGVVSYGKTPALGREARSRVTRDGWTRRFHTAELTALEPGTRYFYRVRTGKLVSQLYDFRTPHAADAEKPVRIVALADMQWDHFRPAAFRELVEGPLLGTAQQNGGPAGAFDMVLIAGDLVRDGRWHRHWTREFFAPLRALSSHVPIYPVLGNHEENDAFYFQYFRLPDNGPKGLAEHAWWTDRGNVRVIGLDSNFAYQNKEQLVWLEGVLEEACRSEHVDFLVAAAHHPERSELWPRGAQAYTGLIASRLEDAAERCGKPALLLTGHTHGYSRGHSKNHALTMITVGSAGGRIDHFGDHPQVDYPEYVTSQDDYGYVLLEATGGAQPRLHIRRVRRGDEHEVHAQVTDQLVLKRHNVAPEAPVAMSPQNDAVDPTQAVLVASPFRDADGDAFGAVEFQLAGEGCDFAVPLYARWVQAQNEWAGQSTQRHEDQRRLMLPELDHGATYCYRVRVRDASLAWSNWSLPQRFHTTTHGVAKLDTRHR